MFLSKEEYQDDLSALKKKMGALGSDLDSLLEKTGMNREEFDHFMSDPSHFTGADWHVISEQLDEFKQTLDLATFADSTDEMKKKREEMKAQSHWMSKRHIF